MSKELKDKTKEEVSIDRINYLISKGIITELQVSEEHKYKIKKVK